MPDKDYEIRLRDSFERALTLAIEDFQVELCRMSETVRPSHRRTEPPPALTPRGFQRYFPSVETSSNTETTPGIREGVLRNPRYPVHRIADQLLPYLRVLVEQFEPRQVILFGSYANGEPNSDSDVDLIIVKELQRSPVRELADVLKAWRPVRWQGNSIPFELLIETPANHQRRASQPGSFYAEAVRTGLRLA